MYPERTRQIRRQFPRSRIGRILCFFLVLCRVRRGIYRVACQGVDIDDLRLELVEPGGQRGIVGQTVVVPDFLVREKQIIQLVVIQRFNDSGIAQRGGAVLEELYDPLVVGRRRGRERVDALRVHGIQLLLHGEPALPWKIRRAVRHYGGNRLYVLRIVVFLRDKPRDRIHYHTADVVVQPGRPVHGLSEQPGDFAAYLSEILRDAGVGKQRGQPGQYAVQRRAQRALYLRALVPGYRVESPLHDARKRRELALYG